MSATIVMDAGSPVVGSIEAPVSTVVALSNSDDSGVLGWQWTLLDRPAGSSATLSTPTASTSSITLDVEGTYLIRLETYADAGHAVFDDADTQAAAVRYTGTFTWRIPAAGETTQYSARGWTAELNAILKEVRTTFVGLGSTTLTGDVTGTGSTSIATTIANNAVTNAKLADVSTQTFKGRTTAGSGDPEDLTGTQATALLDSFVGDSGSGGLKGLVPAPAAGDAAANKFLKADATWTVVPSNVVAGPGSSTDSAIVLWNGTGGDTAKNSNITVNGQIVSTPTVSGTGDSITLKAGSSSVTAGGALYLVGGEASASLGGDIVLRGGRAPTPGNEGLVILDRTETDNRITKLRFVCTDATHITVTPPASASSWTLTLPNTVGSSGQMLVGNGSGVLSWQTPVSNTFSITTDATTSRSLTTSDFPADVSVLLRMTNNGTVTVTVPANSTQAITIGRSIGIVYEGTGTLTVAAAGGVTINTASSLTPRAQHSLITLTKLDTDVWLAAGDLT